MTSASSKQNTTIPGTDTFSSLSHLADVDSDGLENEYLWTNDRTMTKVIAFQEIPPWLGFGATIGECMICRSIRRLRQSVDSTMDCT